MDVESSQVKGELQEAIALWDHLNGWLLDLAKGGLSKASSIFEEWEGPADVEIENVLDYWPDQEALSRSAVAYAQTCLAAVYVGNESSPQAWDYTQRLLQRVATLTQLPQPPNVESLDTSSRTTSLSPDYIGTISKIHALPAELLDVANPLTRPAVEALELALNLLLSAQKLGRLGHKVSLSAVLSLGPLGSEVDQRSVLLRILHGLSGGGSLSDSQWSSSGADLCWLHSWNSVDNFDVPLSTAIFGRLGDEELELGLLRALLSSNRLTLASTWFCQASSKPLPSNKVEEAVIEAGYKAVDSASNGNRTRGTMKKAADIVNVFRTCFPKSAGLLRLSGLIQAIHSLSFYSLTLQHGVPLLPANVRAHQNPLHLIDKVLEQNAKAYTQLDDLLGIGRNFVRAGLIRGMDHGPEGTRKGDAQFSGIERSIITSTIRAALAQHDFDTAYAYITNRLPGFDTISGDAGSAQPDDTLWKAAFEAGRYQPELTSGPSNLRQLEQKMELLSQALILAPAQDVPEVLHVWRDAEKHVDQVSVRESKQDAAWRQRGEQRLPGAFVHDPMAASLDVRGPGGAAGGEAPMGLFDVARGAAAALHKSAFPLHGQRTATLSNSGEGDDDDETATGVARVRKRDVVSSMVTGGLASGIGWVLGE